MTKRGGLGTLGLIGGVLGALGVGAGAFAAHGLKARLTPEMLAIWETAARYQIYHALAIFAALAVAGRGGRGALAAGWCFVAGVILFSGSLYVLALSEVKILGAVTPFGGVAFMVGWLLLAVAAWRAA